MNLPPLLGSLPPQTFCIYTACDEHYFDQYAKSFVNSIQRNSGQHIHLHVFNPRDDQIEFAQKIPSLTLSYEYVEESAFDKAAEFWQRHDLTPEQQTQLARTQQAMIKGHDRDLQQRMLRTYYACIRFVRLAEIIKSPVFAMDIDAVVRRSLASITELGDIVLHRVTGKKARWLAGGMFLDGSQKSHKFLQNYTKSVRDFFEKDYIYWGIDQDQLEIMASPFHPSHLPIDFIDWNMRPDSAVWTAKGTRKESQIFLDERDRYNRV